MRGLSLVYGADAMPPVRIGAPGCLLLLTWLSEKLEAISKMDFGSPLKGAGSSTRSRLRSLSFVGHARLPEEFISPSFSEG